MRFPEGNSEQNKTHHNWAVRGPRFVLLWPSSSFRVGQEVRTKLTEWQEAFVKSICERSPRWLRSRPLSWGRI